MKKIGEIAVSKKQITEKDRERVLELQKKLRESGVSKEESLFGDLLISEGFVSYSQVRNILSEQDNSIEYLFTMLELRNQSFQFGKYKVFEFISRGGMGSVYKAKDENGKNVALKIISWQMNKSTNPCNLKKRFLRENKLLQKIQKNSNPNIVKIYDYGELEGLNFFVMEYLEGETLDKALNSTLTPKEWLEKYIDLLHGINKLHKSNIIHRDLKPQNIMLQKSTGRLILLDFGLSKELESDTSLHTTQVMGSPPYMSPEQTCLGEEHDNKTDIWSLGAILYQIITKQLPFKEKNKGKLLHAIRYKEQPPMWLHDENIPWQMDAICNCALQKNKVHRYKSASTMAKDIECFLAKKKIFAEKFRRWPSIEFSYGKIYIFSCFFALLIFSSLSVVAYRYYMPLFIVLMSLSLVSIWSIIRSWKYKVLVNKKEIKTISNTKEKVYKFDDVKNCLDYNNRILVETTRDKWISPKVSHLKPNNFRDVIYEFYSMKKMDLDMARLLLEGHSIKYIAKYFSIQENTALISK